jgi:hypothetical protein
MIAFLRVFGVVAGLEINIIDKIWTLFNSSSSKNLELVVLG